MSTAFPRGRTAGAHPTWVPTRPADYGDFMAAAVLRYPQVRRWIVFAEPSHYVNFRPQGGGGRRAPRLYAQLLDAAYGAMHAVRRDVVVIGGNVHPAGSNDETHRLLTRSSKHGPANGRRPRMDMFGINPYTERNLDMKLPHRAGRVDFNDLDWLTRPAGPLLPRPAATALHRGVRLEHRARSERLVVRRLAQEAGRPPD